jgi:tRNA A64-2'-O-ribosylphosphate transferase
LITCETGRDLCVGVALMLLCLFYDDEGNVTLRPDLRTFSKIDSNGNYVWSSVIETIDKFFIRRRLAWIVSSHSDANPSRTTLQSINGFLMERPN